MGSLCTNVALLRHKCVSAELQRGPIDRNGAATCDFMRTISKLFKHESEIFKDASDCFEVFKDI